MSDTYSYPNPSRPELPDAETQPSSSFKRLSELTLKALMSAGDRIAYGAGAACAQILSYDGDSTGLRASVNASFEPTPAEPQAEVVIDLR